MDKIIPSFKKTIFESSKDSLIDLGELGIDSLLDEGIFKDVPIVKLLIGVKNTAQNIHDRNLLIQTIQFIQEFNNGTIDEEKLAQYKEKINNDNHKAEEELGRVLIILNNNIELKKSKMIANLYRNYINEVINWNEFCEFSEIVRMLFLSDLAYLGKIYSGEMQDTSGISLYHIDRLTSLGLVNTSMKDIFVNNPDSRTDKYVNLTSIGKKFYQTINNKKEKLNEVR